jgi:penicillin-binding protein 1A
VSKVSEQRGKVLVESQPPVLENSERAIDARNAFLMTSLFGEVTRSGTAARAQATLKRADIYGKTGTTNDSMDAWFAGYHPTLTAVTWIGYDNPRKLGDRETGGGLSLPVWITFMESALKNVPIVEPVAPEGVVQVGGEWYFDEFAKGAGVSSLGVDDKSTTPQALPEEEEKKKILDLFKTN